MLKFQPEPCDLNRLVLFRQLLKDPIIEKLKTLFETGEARELSSPLLALCLEQGEKLGLRGPLIQQYLVYRITLDENLFSLITEQGAVPGDSLKTVALADLTLLKNFIQLPWSKILVCPTLHNYSPTQPQPNPILDQLFTTFMNDTAAETLLDLVTKHFSQNGCGRFAKYQAFRFDPARGLVGIDKPERIRFSDLLGYERQKQTLRRNTEAFVKDLGGNNVLLTGAKGTGKSSCVKALLTEYGSQGLRLVEIAKQDIGFLPDLLKLLRTRGCKFIIFLDDLSFEDFEGDYKYLKSLLEGGLESRPANVLIYATSNRRHLIKEVWSDRRGSTEEVHNTDGLQEKLSLSDRFGLTVTFLPPDQEEYLAMVDHLAGKAGVRLPIEELHRQALQWELSQHGRSGRTARQFVQNLLTFLTEGDNT